MMGFRLDRLGVWSNEFEFEVRADHAKAYAAATNDDVRAHISGELAPPNFAVVPMYHTDVLGDVLSAVVDLDAHEAMRVLHGEQDLFIHQPILPGMVLRIRGKPFGVHGKATGTTVVIQIDTTDQHGAPVNSQYVTFFYRGVQTQVSGGEEAPDHVLPTSVLSDDPIAIVRQRFDEDQTFRYADASGDRLPLHLDGATARSVGLPGIVIHGLCAMGFASHAVIGGVGESDSRRLARLAVRFSHVAFPGEEISTHIWRSTKGRRKTEFVFETVNREGNSILTNGLAEFRA